MTIRTCGMNPYTYDLRGCVKSNDVLEKGKHYDANWSRRILVSLVGLLSKD